MEEVQVVCPLYHQAVELVGKRWNGAIIRALLPGSRRFSELLVAVPGISDRLLSKRLKYLEANGIIARLVFPTTPVRVEYCLTEKGHDLERVMSELQQWAHRWLGATQSKE